jgi:hypothetical protein
VQGLTQKKRYHHFFLLFYPLPRRTPPVVEAPRPLRTPLEVGDEQADRLSRRRESVSRFRHDFSRLLASLPTEIERGKEGSLAQSHFSQDFTANKPCEFATLPLCQPQKSLLKFRPKFA